MPEADGGVPVRSAKYCHRLHAFRERTCYEATADALELTAGEKTERIPYGAVRWVRLAFEPTRFERNRYRMLIGLPGGHRLELTNQSYRGFADFESHDAAYADFVRALHRALAKSGAKPVYRAGNSLAGYIANAAVLIGSGLLLFFVLPLFFAGYGSVATVTIKLLTVVVMLPVAIAYMWRNVPQGYAPDAIPETVLPALSADGAP